MSAVVLEDVEDLGSTEQRRRARRALLEWYDCNHRTLPWRRNVHSQRPGSAAEQQASSAAWPTAPGGAAPLTGLSPADFAYGVWVSEVMSQQTQVDRVAVYFCKWMAKWPRLRDLAAADAEDVNAAWAGLGYYRRARFLHQGAQYAVAHRGGELPGTVEELLKVPGIGACACAGFPAAARQKRAHVTRSAVL
jgi:A/G-specific adenine glycosylase